MSKFLGSQKTPIDDTTMVIYRGSRKPVDPSRKRELAKRCGIDFIKLIYKDNLTTNVGVSGFQHVKIRTQPRKGGGVEPVAQWQLNMYTMQPMAEGSLDFVPDEMGTGIAYLPDSPFNRVRLASAEINNNALWTIDDKDIHRQILKLAEEIKQSIEYQTAVENAERAKTEVDIRVRENNVKVGIEHKSRIEIEIGVLENRVKEMEAAKKRDQLKRRLAELQGNYAEYIDEQNSTILENSKTIEPMEAESETSIEHADKIDESVDTILNQDEILPDDDDIEFLKIRAKTEILNENKELIETVKSKYLKRTGKNRGWGFSPEYQRMIHPLIEKRLKEIIENEHSTVSVID
jgi:hypothetical protein